MSLQTTLLASALLSSLALASPNPQWGGPPGSNGGAWGAGGPFAAFPSCASSCRPSNTDWSSAASLCDDSSTLSTLSSCIGGTSCSDSDKSAIQETIAQLCVNAGASITQSPYNTYSVTSGGSAWPSAWTTNSAWASAVSAWSVSGGPGWHGGAIGPFGGPLSGGPWSSGPWESGAWTKWWGTNACPPSTWSGWTAGPWGTSAPWTSWTACSATATASTVYEITTTNAAGSQITSASTSYGYQLAENAASTGTATTTGSGAIATNLALIGSAAGAVGVLAGAILL